MEVQRRTNVPPLGISHRAICDTELFGYKIPKGTIVLPSLYSIHMDPKYWKDPLAFRPERFLDNNKRIAADEKFFAPFGYGVYYYQRCLKHNVNMLSVESLLLTTDNNFQILINPVSGFSQCLCLLYTTVLYVTFHLTILNFYSL